MHWSSRAPVASSWEGVNREHAVEHVGDYMLERTTKALAVAFWIVACNLCAVVVATCVSVVVPGIAYAEVAGLSDGVYALGGFGVSTGMISLDETDAPPTLVVEGNSASLVVNVYNPNKYDAIWKGKRSEAPDDPSSAEGLIAGFFVPMDDAYQAAGAWRANVYTDDEGVSYKSVRFTIPVTEDDLGAGKVYFVVRRAPWSPSNPGDWMGSSNNYFSFTPIGQAQETPLDLARRLIAALPADCYDISSSDAEAVAAAQAAYDALDATDQATLDTEVCASNQSYGRVLEASVWRIASFGAVDNATTLADGTYTGKATAASDMGKSTSARARTWSIDKVTVADGLAMALITWSGSSLLGSLQLGGQTYDNVGSGGLSQFQIPVDFNTDMYFAVKIRDAVDSTVAIAYHFVATLDESSATPDVDDGSGTGDDSGDGGDSDAGEKSGDDDSDDGKGSGTTDDEGGKKGGKSGQKSSNATSEAGDSSRAAPSRVSSSESVSVAASSASGSAGTVARSASQPSVQAASTEASDSKTRQSSGKANANGAASQTNAVGAMLYSAEEGDSAQTVMLTLALFLLAAAGGAIAFVARYRKEERSWQ